MWIDVEQNTDEWLTARTGKVTGSAISKVMANYGKAFGEPAKKLAVNIAVQQITGKYTESTYSNEHMERGHAQEPIARALYEDEFFCSVKHGGFFDNGFTGCSPDGILDDGLIEIKSVIASTQYTTIKKDGVDSAYKWQVIFNLKESEKEWLDYISYCSEFPLGRQLFIKRLFASQFEKEFKEIDERLDEYKELVESIKSDISHYEY